VVCRVLALRDLVKTLLSPNPLPSSNSTFSPNHLPNHSVCLRGIAINGSAGLVASLTPTPQTAARNARGRRGSVPLRPNVFQRGFQGLLGLSPPKTSLPNSHRVVSSVLLYSENLVKTSPPNRPQVIRVSSSFFFPGTRIHDGLR
jgi:hypothetical protein